MNKFKYKIIDNSNHPREGEIEGEDIQRVADSLLGQGYTILDLKPAGFSLARLQHINIGGIPFKEKVTFVRQMSFMINAGLPLTQALEIAQSQIQNEQFKEIVAEIIKDVQSGMSLSKSLDRHPKVFDVVVRNLIKAGEESGKLDIIMNRVADDLEQKQEFDGKVKGALIYPIVILIAIAAVVVMLLVYMIPQMSKLFDDRGEALPLPTQIIINASNFLRGPGGLVLLFLIIGLAIAYVYYRKTPSGRLVTDRMFVNMPIFGELIRKSQITSFANTFALLISAGVPILDALSLVAASTTNVVFRNGIEAARKKVEKGIPLSQPIISDSAFPPLVGHMIKVGEETGKIDEVLSKVGTQYKREVDQMADNLTKLMEPVILIVMGIVVGVLAIAVYLPIFSLGATASGIK
jgi:type IV pilus assembly protein PilC